MPSSGYHYVYILVCGADSSRHYTGITTDLQDRLKCHNEGRNPHTAKFRPWRVETAIRFSDPAKAIAFERYLKSGSGRAFAIKHL